MILLTADKKKQRGARAIPGAYWDWEAGGFVLDPRRDMMATRAAIRLFPEYEERLPDDIKAELSLALDLRPPDVVTPWVGGRTPEELLPNVPPLLVAKLYEYQAHDIAFQCARMRADGGGYLGWDRGLGKTLATIVAMYELQAVRIVIVGPNSAKDTVWVPEINKWDVKGRYDYNIHNLGGTKAQRDRTVARWKVDGGILLAHYEVLRLVDSWPECDLIVVDEAHRLARGGPGASAPAFYKALKKIKGRHRLALSGSVIINSPEDIFGAAHWLFPKHYSSKWKDWNNRFFEYADNGFGKSLIGLKSDRTDELRRELAGFLTIRTKKDELPGLPDRIDQDMYVQLSETQRKVYDDLREKFLADLPDGTLVTAGTVLAQLTKLRQIATGLDLLGESISDSSKLDLAVELVMDNLPHKTVVFAWHRATVNAMAERLLTKGVECATVHGDVPITKRAPIVDRFQSDPECKVIIATIKTLGESVTLHSASDVIFLEQSWTPADMQQAADRVYRIGQTRHVTVTNILAQDTVDEFKMLPTLKNKEALRRLVLGD